MKTLTLTLALALTTLVAFAGEKATCDKNKAACSDKKKAACSEKAKSSKCTEGVNKKSLLSPKDSNK